MPAANVESDGSGVFVSGRDGDTIIAPACTPPGGPVANCGDPARYDGVVFVGTSGNDQFTASTPLAVEASGGTGNDNFQTGSGADLLDGGPGADTLYSGDGDDRVLGGPGDDSIFSGRGNDTIDGGTGNDMMGGGYQPGDTVDYWSRTAPVTFKFDVYATGGGGEAGEFDSVYGVYDVIGGSGGDELTGNGDANRPGGGPGDDVLDGGAGGDQLDGGPGDDDLTGGPGSDSL